MSSNPNNTIEATTQLTREYPPRPTIAPRERDDLYYTLLAGAAKTKLLESWYDLRLPAVLAERGPLTAAEISDALGLHLKRAGKWLVLLCRIGLLNQQQGRFLNSEAGIAMFWAKDGRENYFMKDQMEYCRWVNALDFNQVLRGMALPDAVRWPPRTKEAAAHLELWMTVTANEAVAALEAGTDWSKVGTLLDVGGGDATIACALVRKFEHLHVTVFNLPASAELARARIAREKLESRVSVVVGDFIKEGLPKGFDRVMFSRVLADWEPSVTQMLLKKAYSALRPGGSIVISEPLDDSNKDLAVSWEYRYTFYDDFGVQTYKSRALYEAQLKVAGCSSFTFHDRIDETLYGVITAQ